MENTASAHIRREFDRSQEDAKEVLLKIIRSATQAAADIDAGKFQRTDFLSQHTARYAEIVARQSALSTALGIALYFEEQQP